MRNSVYKKKVGLCWWRMKERRNEKMKKERRGKKVEKEISLKK